MYGLAPRSSSLVDHEEMDTALEFRVEAPVTRKNLGRKEPDTEQPTTGFTLDRKFVYF